VNGARGSPAGRSIGRREFLLGAATVAGGAVLVACRKALAPTSASPAGSIPPAGNLRLDGLAYRLSTGGATRACGACRAHAANKYFMSASDADSLRAHPGCNCRVLKQPITSARFTELFQGSNGQLRTTFDARATLGG